MEKTLTIMLIVIIGIILIISFYSAYEAEIDVVDLLLHQELGDDPTEEEIKNLISKFEKELPNRKKFASGVLDRVFATTQKDYERAIERLKRALEGEDLYSQGFKDSLRWLF